jgi:hypothetical protein
MLTTQEFAAMCFRCAAHDRHVRFTGTQRLDDVYLGELGLVRDSFLSAESRSAKLLPLASPVRFWARSGKCLRHSFGILGQPDYHTTNALRHFKKALGAISI